MKMDWKNDRWTTRRNCRPHAGRSEMDGLIELGMKAEALRRARTILKQSPITAEAFNDALNAIQTLTGRIKPWAELVEAAYMRLPKRQRPRSRFWIMAFRNASRNHEGVLKLTPGRFAGEWALLELAYALEASFELGRTEIMEKLARRLPHAITEADHPMMQSYLLLSLAEYLARKGKWDEAIAVLEEVQSNETFERNAVTAIVELHVARALKAVRLGFRLLQQFNQDFDPSAEIIVPGNDKAVREQAAEEFGRLQKTLVKIVPPKRQVELGLLAHD